MFIIPGEANFLGGVASVKGVAGFSPEAAKKRFFEIYLEKVISLQHFPFLLLTKYMFLLFNTYCSKSVSVLYILIFFNDTNSVSGGQM